MRDKTRSVIAGIFLGAVLLCGQTLASQRCQIRRQTHLVNGRFEMAELCKVP